MAIFDFLRNKGKKLFGASRSQSGSGGRSSSGDSRQQQQYTGNTGQQQASGASTPQGSAESTRQADVIREHIQSQDVNAPEDLVVLFDANDGVVVIEGVVPDADTAEAIVLIAGDIEGVCTVDDRMQVEGQPSRSAQPRDEELRKCLRSSAGASSGASTGAPSGTSR
jgi:osmotically-inducible protein OsmY